MEHCIAKICEIVDRPAGDVASHLPTRLQLGAISEMTGLGRGPFWDRWKVAVAEWDSAELKRLARELQTSYSHERRIIHPRTHPISA